MLLPFFVNLKKILIFSRNTIPGKWLQVNELLSIEKQQNNIAFSAYTYQIAYKINDEHLLILFFTKLTNFFIEKQKIVEFSHKIFNFSHCFLRMPEFILSLMTNHLTYDKSLFHTYVKVSPSGYVCEEDCLGSICANGNFFI